MEDSTITKVSFVLTLIGIAGVAATAYLAEPYELDTISESDIGKIVKLQGVAESVRRSGDALFLEVDGFRIVQFSAEETNIKDGYRIEVTGRVSLYKGNLEIIADSVKNI